MNTDKNIYINDLSEILQSSGCPIVPSKLKDNDVMRTRELKDALQEIHNRNNYPMTAKCTDLQKKWGIQIKRTTRYNNGNSYGVIEFNI